jgi:uncharacterized membrane protein YvbJ
MFCPNCGKQIPDGSKFCPYCGAKITTIEEQKPLKKEKRKIRLSIILIPIIAVVVVSSVLIYFNFFPRVNPEKSTNYENKGLTTLGEIVSQNQITDKKKLEGAQNNFKTAVKLNPDNVSARKNLVYTYLISDNLTDAQKEVEEILTKNPDDEFALKMKELLSEETP